VRTPTRIACVAAVLAAGPLALTACDASPYAAKVNGHVITVNSFNHTLASWSSNQAVAQSFQQGGVNVVGTGGRGTYSTNFASQVLTTIVNAAIIHQYLASSGHPATSEQQITARAVAEVQDAQIWGQLSPSLRDFLVQELADEGALTQAPTDLSTVQSDFQVIRPNLFSSVCVIEASAFNLAEAQSISSSGPVNGADHCYDQTSLDERPAAFQSAVRGLAAPGDVSQPIKTSYGWVVAKLVSRATLSLDAQVAQVLTARQSAPPAVQTLLTSAHVRVNPAYGTWSNGQVNPPVSPLAPPTTSPNAAPPGS
jgi:hypothetical protein